MPDQLPAASSSSRQNAQTIQVRGSIPEFNYNASNKAQEWKRWMSQFKIYIRATGLENEGDKRKVAILLHYLGNMGLEIFNSFDLDIDTIGYSALLTKFEEYFTPKLNLTYERHKFFTRQQQNNESINDYITVLQNLSLNCQFDALRESLVKDVFICGLNADNIEIKKRLIQENKTTLDEVVQLAQAIKHSTIQTNEISNEENVLGAVYHQNKGKGYNRGRSTKGDEGHTRSRTRSGQRNRSNNRSEVCTRCAQKHRFKCPASNVECNNCHKKGHYAKCCYFKKDNNKGNKSSVNEVKSQSQDSNNSQKREELFMGSIYTFGEVSVNTLESWNIQIKINNHVITGMLDTGAQANVMSMSTFQSLELSENLITPSSVKILTFSKQNLPVRGQTVLGCFINEKQSQIPFIILEISCATVIGLKTCSELKIIKRINSVSFNSEVEHNLFKEFKDVFEGLGCVKKPCHLEIDKSVNPVIEPLRKVPFSLLKDLESELARMEKLGVIIKVDEPTRWVSSIVITKKRNGALRVCLDPRNLNKAILRPHYPFPSIDTVKSKLKGATVFSTLDANSGFWTIPLDSESSQLCTFITPFGRFKFLRLPFGVSSAPELFNAIMVDLFKNIPNIIIYFDDVLVYASSQKEHDTILRTVLERAREVGMKFNMSKSKLNKQSVTYMGHLFDAQGMRPDPNKITAIVNMSKPNNTKELSRFLGMLTYLSPFIKNYSEKTKNLRALLKKNVVWQFNDIHKEEFKNLQNIITKAPVLAYFDENEKLILSCDSSQSAVGAVMLQNNKPIAYASATLTDSQQHYAQIERELLAIVFGCLKFHQYIYGRKIIVHTDHKPLVPLFKKSLNKIPPRLVRLMLKIQQYDLDVIYVPGKKMYISDTLSRAPLPESMYELNKNVEVHVGVLISSLEISKDRLNKFKEQTHTDKSLNSLIQFIKKGFPSDKNDIPIEVRPYLKFIDQIYLADGLVFKGESVIVPQSLRKEMLEIIHQGHFGMSRSIQYAKESLFWPNMVNDIKNVVRSCATCQQFSNNNSRQPLFSHQIKLLPWSKVGIDFMDFQGHKYLVCIDYFSKYIELALMQRTTAQSVIKELKSIFSRHGIPSILVSDNGPPFGAIEFQNFMKAWDIEHVTSSPNYPQSNGQVERAVQTLKNMLIKSSHASSDIYLTLLQYRNTATNSLASPSQLLMSRKLRTVIPTKTEQLKPKVPKPQMYHKYMQNKAKSFKTKGKNLSPLHTNDVVIFKLLPSDKKWSKGVIIKVGPEPRSYVISSNGRTYRRNRVQIKKFYDYTHVATDYSTSDNDVCDNICANENNTAIDFEMLPTEVIPEQNNTGELKTRSGRIVNRPNRLNL